MKVFLFCSNFHRSGTTYIAIEGKTPGARQALVHCLALGAAYRVVADAVDVHQCASDTHRCESANIGAWPTLFLIREKLLTELTIGQHYHITD